MRLQAFHDDQRLLLIKMQDFGHAARIPRFLTDQCMIFEEGPLERQRPAVTDQAHVRKRLLDNHAAGIAFHNKDQVEVAVADFPHRPGIHIAADGLFHDVEITQPLAQALWR